MAVTESIEEDEIMKEIVEQVTEDSTSGSTKSKKIISPTSDKPQVFECDICKKVFHRKAGLTVHIQTHNEKTIPCTMCDRLFKTKGLLKDHMGVHLQIKNYECEVCKKRFRTSTHLTSHRRTHTKERPYQCDLCERAFTVSNALTIHRRIHTGERPYKCDLCEKGFRESSKLAVHKRSHTKEKPYSCDVCSNTFSQLGNLRMHMAKFHTFKDDDERRRFECNVCNKKFMDQDYLKIHMKYHSGVKNYACELCPKKFTTGSELKLHVDYHNGVKRYKCDKCGKEFFQHHHWKHHMKMHDSDKKQCHKCKRFLLKQGIKKHKCLPETKQVSQNPKVKIKKILKKTKSNEDRSDDEYGSTAIQQIHTDNIKRTSTRKKKFIINYSTDISDNDEKDVDGIGGKQNQMVSLHTSIDIKDEVSDAEEENELFDDNGFEALLERDSQIKPQINLEISQDEETVDDPESRLVVESSNH